MKDGVVVVNTARGAVMDEEALVQALDSGKVYSAGLDVFEEEPKVHPGLIRNPNVILVPHMGTWTVEVRFQTTYMCLLVYLSIPIHLLTVYKYRRKLQWRNGRLTISGKRCRLGS